MAYINVVEWTPDQVTDWLKGLDDSMYNYSHSFTNNEVGGQELLNIRPYELEQLGMRSIGHQEIVLEAVEYLRNFHYNLDNDNLQFMALHIATASRNLHRQLAKDHCDATKIETRTLHDITRTIATIKPLISWLERAPFCKQDSYREVCRNLLRPALELATIAQRDRFVEQPVEQIRATAEKLEKIANFIIQDISDPMLLQPAALNLVTLKKRESDLGFNIESTYHGIHRVIDIKYNSPAHNSGKIEDGDEIVQINYQTVVGWQYKTVLMQLREALPDVVLTVKKRPKHTKMFGQIYMQPYRLPSKKRSIATRWGENLPSPRAGLLTLMDDGPFKLPLTLKDDEKAAAAASSDTDSSCSDILTPTDTKSTTKEIRLYYPKPRAMLQRRNTICGDEFLSHKHADLTVLSWHERKAGATVCDPVSPSLRDKSVSFGFGLEITPRPTTCIGIASGSGAVGGGVSTKCATGSGSDMKSLFSETKPLQQVIESASETQQDVQHIGAEEKSVEDDEKYKPGVSKVVRFDANMKFENYPRDEKYTCNVENTILETFEPIPFVDEGDEDALETLRSCKLESAADIVEALDKASKYNETTLVEAINAPLLQNRRGRLDKSHSTPAYDNSGEESDTPPAIEPRKEFLLVTPPIPPPRPRKQKEQTPIAVPPPPPKPASMQAASANATQQVSQIIVVNEVDATIEVDELHTPTKSRTLTLKKKHSLIAKRRNINLKLLGTGDIQGHLYRRKKDHRGVTYWARVYFVMLDTILYGFRTKQSNCASCVIFLPGFTVSLAKEVHSKPYAFKVYHPAKTFYFAAESQDALNQWVEFLRQASLQSNAGASDGHVTDVNNKELYSENDSSGEENDAVIAKNLCTPSPQSNKDMASSILANAKSGANTPTSTITTTSNKHDRSYLGSLRKLKIGTLPFKSNSAKPSSDIPVPTEQYRSYRKVPGGSFGIQIGANTPGYHDPASSTPPSTITTSTQTPTEQSRTVTATIQRKLSRSSSRSSIVSNTESSTSLGLGPPSSPAPTLTSLQQQSSLDSPSKSLKKIPYNFLHASNPNLVEFDFQTSKTLDYSMPKITGASALDTSLHHSTQGFVTLKDLMLRKKEEEAQEMYNNRVLLGVEKQQTQKMRAEAAAAAAAAAAASKALEQNNAQATIVPSKTQNRSLPKTPDYAISFKPDDAEIKRTRTREGLKLRDFGYELISGDEPIGGVGSVALTTGTTTISHHSNNSLSSAEQRYLSGGGASTTTSARQFLKTQLSMHKNSKKQANPPPNYLGIIDVNGSDKRTNSNTKKKGKMSSDRLFHFHKHTDSNNASTASGMTMTLPLNKKSKSNHALESVTGCGGSIKKSHTYNNDLKGKAGVVGKYEAQRKNSAPVPIFAKLTFPSTASTASPTFSNSNNSSGKPSKEKRLLGSPLLHRTIFGHHNIHAPAIPSPTMDHEYDQEIFSQIIFPNHRSQHNDVGGYNFRNTSATPAHSNGNICVPDQVAPPLPVATTPTTAMPHDVVVVAAASTVVVATPNSQNSADSKAATPEYPNMECPPVFEPEIYSLTDSSLTLLLRRNNSSTAEENP